MPEVVEVGAEAPIPDEQAPVEAAQPGPADEQAEATPPAPDVPQEVAPQATASVVVAAPAKPKRERKARWSEREGGA